MDPQVEGGVRAAASLSWAQQQNYYRLRLRWRTLRRFSEGHRWVLGSRYQLCLRPLEALVLCLLQVDGPEPALPELLRAIRGQAPPSDALVFLAKRLLASLDQWGPLLFPYAALVLFCEDWENLTPQEQWQLVRDEWLTLMEELRLLLQVLQGLGPDLEYAHWDRWEQLEAQRQWQENLVQQGYLPPGGTSGTTLRPPKVLLDWWTAPNHLQRLARWPGLPKLTALLRRRLHRRLPQEDWWKNLS